MQRLVHRFRRSVISESVLVKNVQYVPGLYANLLSVSQIIRQGNSNTFYDRGCRIINAKMELVATAMMTDHMYKLDRMIADKCFSI